MRPYCFHPEAEEELDEIMRFYKSRQIGLERRFFEAIEDTIFRIRRNPLMYRQVEGDIRKCRVPRFPYGLIYRSKDDLIEVIAVMPLRRNPEHLKGRTLL